MTDRTRTITIGAITAVVAAILGLLTEFGVGLTAKQQESILVVIAALGPIIAGLIDGIANRTTTPYEEQRYDRYRPAGPTGPATPTRPDEPGEPGGGPARPRR